MSASSAPWSPGPRSALRQQLPFLRPSPPGPGVWLDRWSRDRGRSCEWSFQWSWEDRGTRLRLYIFQALLGLCLFISTPKEALLGLLDDRPGRPLEEILFLEPALELFDLGLHLLDLLLQPGSPSLQIARPFQGDRHFPGPRPALEKPGLGREPVLDPDLGAVGQGQDVCPDLGDKPFLLLSRRLQQDGDLLLGRNLVFRPDSPNLDHKFLEEAHLL